MMAISNMLRLSQENDEIGGFQLQYSKLDK
jgi:hypothetical protein